ncbi:hypothetical protein [Sedimenticola sp.]|uniref:hypothetical protein n=1 Tax=Sedimenticola sp. TaxID=1940285 RepID=UPI003D133D99
MMTSVTAGKKIYTFLVLTTLASVTMAAEDSNSQTQSTSEMRLPFELYRTPSTQTASEGDQLKSCLALEQEMAALVPKTYSYKPDFYNDPYQGTSIWVGTTLFMPAYALSGYAGYLQYKENGRIISAEERIEVLRRLKAQQHCFES